MCSVLHGTACKSLSWPLPGELVSLAQATDKLTSESQLLGCLSDLHPLFAPFAPATLASLLSQRRHAKLVSTPGPLCLLFLLPRTFFLPPGLLPHFIQASLRCSSSGRLADHICSGPSHSLSRLFLHGAIAICTHSSSMYLQTVAHWNRSSTREGLYAIPCTPQSWQRPDTQ